jgi:hypothetical protein
MKISRYCLGAALLAAIGGGAGVSSAGASALVATNVSGLGNFLVVDQATGKATSVDPETGLGPDSWAGLASVPGGDPAYVYALQNPTPEEFGDPPTSRLVKINSATGIPSPFPLFDVDILGSPGPTSTALAINPLNPNVATVVAFEFESPGDRLLFKVSLATGEVLGPALVLPQRTAIRALTYSPDGRTLYASDAQGALATLNEMTGVLTTVGDPAGLSNFINGLAFRPEDGALFAIDAGLNDRLVQLNPATGALISVIGPFGITGPAGLTFVDTPVSPVMGDANFDGRVDLEDLNAVRNTFGAIGVGHEGDVDGNGFVDLADLNAVRNNFGAVGGSPVPEPATWTLATLTAMLGCWYGHRRRMG